MGGVQSFAQPEQFVVQSRGDWEKQAKSLYRKRPTITKSVILPPGVELNDPRLKQGEVVEEKHYFLDPSELGYWPSDHPFEVDVDRTLVPPCYGRPGVAAHYAVYPDSRFTDSNCGLCALQKKAANAIGKGGITLQNPNEPVKKGTKGERRATVSTVASEGASRRGS